MYTSESHGLEKNDGRPEGYSSIHGTQKRALILDCLSYFHANLVKIISFIKFFRQFTTHVVALLASDSFKHVNPPWKMKYVKHVKIERHHFYI